MRRWLVRLSIVGVIACLSGLAYAEDNKQMKADVEIMCAIFDRAIELESGGLSFHPKENCRGVYLEGYGVVFMVQAGLPFGGNISFGEGGIGFGSMAFGNIEGKMKKGKEGEKKELPAVKKFTMKLSDGPHTPEAEDGAIRLKERFSELLARYGPTIRQLKPKDGITVVIFRGPFPGATKSTLIIQVKGKILTEFKAGKIDLKRFKDRLKFTEY